MLIGATRSAVAFIEIGAVALALSVLARAAARVHVSPIPLYLFAGLLVGDGGIAPLDVSADFIRLAGDIGALLLLLTLGLEYSAEQLRTGLRRGLGVALLDGATGFAPGLAVGLLLGWEAQAAVLLGGASWISSSGVAAKLIRDLRRSKNPETPAILNVLVLEDLAVAVFLPVVGATIASESRVSALTAVGVAVCALGIALTVALRWGKHLSRVLAGGSDESLLLSVFGLTLLVAGLAEQVQVSAAIGAFLLGVALSDVVYKRVAPLVAPLRDLFAAVFFLFFSFGIDPQDLRGAILPALLLVALSVPGKFAVGWHATRDLRCSRNGRLSAGATLVARGEFSIIIAALGAQLADAAELAAVAAGYVLLTATIGPLASRYFGGPPPRDGSPDRTSRTESRLDP